MAENVWLWDSRQVLQERWKVILGGVELQKSRAFLTQVSLPGTTPLMEEEEEEGGKQQQQHKS